MRTLSCILCHRTIAAPELPPYLYIDHLSKKLSSRNSNVKLYKPLGNIKIYCIYTCIFYLNVAVNTFVASFD